MDRNEFIIAVMVLLSGSYLLGFLTHWIVTRLSRVSDAEISQLDELAEDLHRAEDERDQARADRHRLDIETRAKIGELRSELVSTQEALTSAETELNELRDLQRDEKQARQA